MLRVARRGFATAGLQADFDAERRFDVEQLAVEESSDCISGLILQGIKRPHECSALGKRCTPEHPLWAKTNVIVSPHYSGDTVNLSAVPGERFARNLRSWLAGKPMEGVVRLEHGY